MKGAFDSKKFTDELNALQQRMEASRSKAYDSMREVVAIRRFGGAASGWDEAEVVFAAVDENGAPTEVRLAEDWRDEYAPEELPQAIAQLARALEQDRVVRATQHIADFPEEFEAISDEEVEAEFNAIQGKTVSAPTTELEEMDAQAAELSKQVTELRTEVEARQAQGYEAFEDERPVTVLMMAGMLVGIRISPDFIQRSSTVQINAAIANEIARVTSEDDDSPEDESLASRLQATEALARAFASTLRADRGATPSAFTRN